MNTSLECQAARRQKIYQMLADERAQTCERIRKLRCDQSQDVTPAPADNFDEARSLAEVETHASLIEAAERRLEAIDDAVGRLARNHYGLCEQCGNEIPIERLQALPFAALCVGCQRKRDSLRNPAANLLGEQESRVWSLTAETDDSLEKQDDLAAPEEHLSVRDKNPFGAELGKFEQMAPSPTSGRRGRIKQNNSAE
jgi:RNA polymerase-binding protein DksA